LGTAKLSSPQALPHKLTLLSTRTSTVLPRLAVEAVEAVEA
jgi:hypothetical protein